MNLATTSGWDFFPIENILLLRRGIFVVERRADPILGDPVVCVGPLRDDSRLTAELIFLKPSVDIGGGELAVFLGPLLYFTMGPRCLATRSRSK